MSMRMLSRSTPSTPKSSKNIAAESLSASRPSIPALSSSTSPRSPPHSPVLEPPDSQHPLSSPPPVSPAPAPFAAGPSSLHSPLPTYPSSSSSITGSTGFRSPSLRSGGTNGVVVVGVIGRVGQEVSRLLDRLLDLDSHVLGVDSGIWGQCHENVEQGSPASASASGVTTRERKQRKDGSRLWETEDQQQLGVIEGEGRMDDSEGSAMKGGRSRRGTRLQSGEGLNGNYSGRRDGKVEGARNEKAPPIARGDSDLQKKGPVENTSTSDGGNGDSSKIWDGWLEAHRHVPVSLRKLKIHHDEEKGMLYVQFTWGDLPLDCVKGDPVEVAGAPDGSSSLLEHHEADGMRGLLFMFSVCHVILLVQDGASFNPRFLRMLRLLQAAKFALIPFVKSQVLPALLTPSSASKSSPLKPVSLATSSVPSRTGVLKRNLSTIGLMSGSTPVLYPGQCIPVVLFVCLDGLGEPAVGPSPHERTGSQDGPDVSISTVSKVGSLFPQSGNFLPRQTPHTRHNNKFETGLRKKLQSSMEAQIRFLLKKCRTVAGSGDVGPPGSAVVPGMGQRGQGSVSTFHGVGGGAALFVLDPSRAIILLDRSAISKIEALEYAIDSMEALMSGSQDLEGALFDPGSNSSVSGEEVQTIKDFIWRQAEMLRGKGGMSTNAAGGAAGVGMVAAAAAAAAVSAASGGLAGTSKTVCNPPELPTFGSWLSACRLLAEALSARPTEEGAEDALFRVSHGTLSVSDKGTAGPATGSGSTGSVIRSKATINTALLCLESGSEVDMKFSAAWCKRVLASAQDVYLRSLPQSYSTSFHKSQLDKAVRVFHAMVRGPAVSVYGEKLKKDCEAVWHHGRQLCDAKSLTGKPCIHQVHKVMNAVSTNLIISRGEDGRQKNSKGALRKHLSRPHSSGVVFLHACACGRSRKLRKDPFEFESANVSFFRFPNCDDLLPSITVPGPSEGLPSGGSPWSLVSLGNSRYYQPAVGLVQSGFCSKQNFLSLWDILLSCRNVGDNVRTLEVPPLEKLVESAPSVKRNTWLDIETPTKSFLPREQLGFETKLVSVSPPYKEKGYSDGAQDTSIMGGFGSSEIRRESTDSASRPNSGSDSGFPPLPMKLDKPTTRSVAKERKGPLLVHQEHENTSSKALHKNSAQDITTRVGTSPDTDVDHVSHVENAQEYGSNKGLNRVTQHVRLYIGFEYECPRGHRFLLSRDQSEKFGSVRSRPVVGTGKHEIDNLLRPSKHKIRDQNGLGKNAASFTRPQVSNPVQQETQGRAAEILHMLSPKLDLKGTTIAADSMQSWTIQDSYGDGHSLLNSDLPIYMDCPYCKISGEQRETSNKGVVFGGTISQLQRIFLVTPPLPLQLAACPVVEFEDMSRPGRNILEFKPGKEVVLPPDSFLSLRLPFVYYSQLDGAPHKPLVVQQSQPEHCAWLVKNTAIYVLSQGGAISPSGG